MMTVLLLLLLLVGIFPLSAYLAHTMRETKAPINTLDGEWLQEATSPSPYDWWERQRGKFNISLLWGGGIVMILYTILYHQYLFNPYTSLRFGLMSILFMVVIYLIYMGVANLFYNLGVMLETLLEPRDIFHYRHSAFGVATWCAIGLPIGALIFIILV